MKLRKTYAVAALLCIVLTMTSCSAYEKALSGTFEKSAELMEDAYKNFEEAKNIIEEAVGGTGKSADSTSETNAVASTETVEAKATETTTNRESEKETEGTKETEITETTVPTTPPATAGTSLDGYYGKPLVDFMDKVSELGYTATYFNQGSDYTSILGFYSREDCASFVVGNVEEDAESKTVVVELLLKENLESAKAEAALEEKLTVVSAWLAAKNYGKSLYGEDFKIHNFAKKIAEYAQDENTWFLKAKCTVAGAEKTCEVLVSGTTDAPEVTSFDVY